MPFVSAKERNSNCGYKVSVVKGELAEITPRAATTMEQGRMTTKRCDKEEP